MNLVELTQRFGTEAAARAYLEHIRWPNGVRCLRCGHDKISRLQHQHKFECARCEYQFSVTVGTIFHRARIGIRKWLIVIYMMMESKKGMSACQIQRMIGVSYPTAWYMCHRIRNAMKVGDTAEKLMGALEIDETYIGPKTDKRGRPNKDSPKVPVIGVIQRGGKVRVTTGQGRDLKDHSGIRQPMGWSRGGSDLYRRVPTLQYLEAQIPP
jgi:transposase-like protein